MMCKKHESTYLNSPKGDLDTELINSQSKEYVNSQKILLGPEPNFEG